MIAVNGKPLNELKEDSKIRILIEEALRSISRERKWKFKFHEALVTEPKPGQPDSYPQTPNGYSILSSQKFMFEGQEYVITYYTASSYDKRGNRQFRPEYFPYGGIKVFNGQQDADKIFFLACLSPYCGTIDKLAKFQKQRKLETVYVLEDLKAEAEAIATLEAEVARIQTALFGKENALPDEKIRDLATKFSVPNAKDLEYDINLVKNALKKKVLVIKNGKYDVDLITKFILMLGKEPDSEIMKVIHRAQELDIIKAEQKMQYPKAWYVVNVDEMKDIKLGDVDDNQKADYNIYTLVFEDKKKIDTILKCIKVKEESEN